MGWVAKSTPLPADRRTPGDDPTPFVQEAGWASWGRSGRTLEISHPTGIPTRDLPTAVYLNTGRKFFTRTHTPHTQNSNNSGTFVRLFYTRRECGIVVNGNDYSRMGLQEL